MNSLDMIEVQIKKRSFDGTAMTITNPPQQMMQSNAKPK